MKKMKVCISTCFSILAFAIAPTLFAIQIGPQHDVSEIVANIGSTGLGDPEDEDELTGEGGCFKNLLRACDEFIAGGATLPCGDSNCDYRPDEHGNDVLVCIGQKTARIPGPIGIRISAVFSTQGFRVWERLGKFPCSMKHKCLCKPRILVFGPCDSEFVDFDDEVSNSWADIFSGLCPPTIDEFVGDPGSALPDGGNP